MISYGSRPKTHARLLVSFSIRVTSADMDVPLCFFCCSGERAILLGRERFAIARRKGSFRVPQFWITPIYMYIYIYCV